MTQLTLVGTPDHDGNNFDALRLTAADGRELWSARDLMAALGYSKWQDFDTAIRRAQIAAFNVGVDVTSNFMDVHKISGTKPAKDYHLTRYAAYMVALNGDPRKPEIAAAQTYFVVRTREAEVGHQPERPTLSGIELLAHAVIEAKALLDAQDLQLEQQSHQIEHQSEQLAIAAPKVEVYDKFLDANGLYSIGTVAKMFGMGAVKFFTVLRNHGILISKGAYYNTPYQRYMRHFEVKPTTIERSNGENETRYTTYAQPSAIPFIARKIGVAVVEPADVS